MFDGQLTVGNWLSFTVTVNEQVLLRPTASVAFQITVVAPLGKAEPLGRPLVRTTEPPAQLSQYVGVV